MLNAFIASHLLPNDIMVDATEFLFPGKIQMNERMDSTNEEIKKKTHEQRKRCWWKKKKLFLWIENIVQIDVTHPIVS